MVFAVLLLCAGALANNPPAAPTITEPSTNGRIVNPEDVHMETGPMSDPDPGDTHAASDWEVLAGSQRVWAAPGVTGALRVHIHLGDGTFQGTHTGRSSLLPDTEYTLRVRHSDSSGDPLTRWSPWSVRTFRTAPLSSVFPMELEDVAGTPAPTLKDVSGAPVRLPAGSSASWIALESPSGPLLLRITGSSGASNTIVNPGPLVTHASVRLRAYAGGAALFLPETNLSFTDEHGADHTISLPALNLAPGQVGLYWVSTNGATYSAQAGQTQPDFSAIARGAPVPWQVEAGHKVEVFATGFQLPVNIAFVPSPGPAGTDPLLYVGELYGRIKVVFRNGTVGTYAADLLNYGPTGIFPGSGEQGLTGLCVDPASGDVFASMVYAPTPPNDELYPKVMRLHSADGGR